MRPPSPRRERNVREFLLRVRLDMCRKPYRSFPQSRVAPRRKRDQVSGTRVGYRYLLRRSLLQDHMRIGTAEPERTHTCNTRTFVRKPRRQRGRNRRVQVAPMNMRIDRPQMQMRRHFPMLQRQHRLDDSGHAGRRFQMPDIRLDRSDQQTPISRPALAHNIRQRLRLNRIAQRRPRPVGFHIAHFGRRNMCVLQRLPQNRPLRRSIGDREAAACPVVIHGGPANHGQNIVVAVQRIGQALQNQNAAPLAANISIRRRIKAAAAPIRRERPHLAKLHRAVRGQH